MPSARALYDNELDPSLIYESFWLTIGVARKIICRNPKSRALELTFAETDKTLRLDSENCFRLAFELGDDYLEWAGKQICLRPESVEIDFKTRRILRVEVPDVPRPPRPTENANRKIEN